MREKKRMNAKLRRMLAEMTEIFNEQNHRHAKRDKTVSHQTRRKRFLNVQRALITLYDDLGFRIESLEGLGGRHIVALTKHWESQGQSATHIANQLSHLRTFFEWIGKPGVVQKLEKQEMFDDPACIKRSYQATKELTWEAIGADVDAAIQRVYRHDPIVAMQLLLAEAFGLRVNEAIRLKPHLADLGDRIAMRWGGKNGRKREIPITHTFLREVLEYAKCFAPDRDRSTIPSQYKLMQWRYRFYYVIRTYGGVGKTLNGATVHGLRHEFANSLYEYLTGLSRPLRKIAHLTPQNIEIDQKARKASAEALGHNRIQIADGYLGPTLDIIAKRKERYRKQNPAVFEE